MPPRTTVWEADPHTLAKHAILRAYLEAWFPILARWKTRIVYYDGFSGPGRYSQGEEGSPLIALRVALDHRAKLDAELVFAFVESDDKRAKHLQSEIDALRLPKHFKVFVINNSFEDELGGLLDEFDKKGTTLAPTFAFIDPFGITGLPFSLVSRILKRPQCEVLITFMTGTVKRFVTELPDQVSGAA